MKRNGISWKKLFSVMLCLTVPVGGICRAAAVPDTSLTVSDLKVNNLTDPLGVDGDITFRWMNTSAEYSKAQSAYRIIVSSEKEQAEKSSGDVWDSGKTPGKDSFDIAYRGDALSSCTPYYWRVMVWDEQDIPSEWSNVAVFETGILSEEEWGAQWIGAANDAISLGGANWIWSITGSTSSVPAGTQYFRGSFTVDPEKTLASAVIGFSTDDYGDVYINGTLSAAVANTAGAWMTGSVADITDVVKSGENSVAAAVTNTDTGFAGFIAKIVIKYTDLSEAVFVTDANWRVSPAAGDSWQTEGFDDSLWQTPSQILPYGSEPWAERVHLPQLTDSAPMLRKSFTVDKEVDRARIYLCGLGLFDLKINGRYADDTVLNPAHTQYNKTVMYRSFDITALLQKGENVIGVELGKSWLDETCNLWGWQDAIWRDDPKMIARMDIRYTDGTVQTVVSGEDWQSFIAGPTTYNSILFGEVYDARREQDGWTQPGFSAANWKNARLADAPTGTLTAQSIEPIRRTGTLEKTITKLDDNTYVIKVPVITTGWARFTFRGLAPGQELVISYAETVTADGYVEDFTNLAMFGRTLQQDHYIARGLAEESFEPKFSYKGYQYIQIDGYTGQLAEDDVVCSSLHNDVEITSDFQCGNQLINTLHENMVRTMLNNFQSKPTDTPVWEKNGYTGDNNVAMETFAYNFDVSAPIGKYMGDVRDTQNDAGVIPDIAPCATNWGYSNIPVWNTVYTTGVYEMWHYFGQTSLIEEHYDGMCRLIDQYISELAGAGWVWPHDAQLSDWVSPADPSNPDVPIAPTSAEGAAICGTAYLYRAMDELAQMADELGKTADALYYRECMAKIYTAFNEKFYVAEKQIYDTGYFVQQGNKSEYRQTSNLAPLAYGLVPEEYKQGVLRNLVDDIISRDYHLDTGMVGTKIILPVLTENGYGDVAYRILTQTTYPSWGHWVEMGATTTWELYENTTRSRDHFFLGTYDEWLFKYMAGIREVENGYGSFTVSPEVYADAGFASASIKTVRGTVSSGWKILGNGKVRFDITVPVGSQATMVIPTDRPESLLLNGKALSADAQGVEAVAVNDRSVSVTALSGSYTFISKLDPNRSVHYNLNLENPQNITAKAVVDGKEYQLPASIELLGGEKEIEILSENSSYEFSHFTGSAYAAGTPVKLSVSSDMTLQANFKYIAPQSEAENPVLSLSVPDGGTLFVNGRESASPYQQSFEKGCEVTVDVIPSAGYRLSGWEGAALLGSSAVIVMNGDVSAQAVFEQIPYESNLAKGKPASSNDSLNVGTAWRIANLTDGIQTGTGYSSASVFWSDDISSSPVWVEIDLEKDQLVNQVVLWPRSDQTIRHFPVDFTISVRSESETEYRTVYTASGHTDAPDEAVRLEFDAVTARYVRLTVTKLSPNAIPGDCLHVQLAEMEVCYTLQIGAPVINQISVTAQERIHAGRETVFQAHYEPFYADDTALIWTVRSADEDESGALTENAVLEQTDTGMLFIASAAGCYDVTVRSRDEGAIAVQRITVTNRLGDISGDGSVGADDLTFVKRALIGSVTVTQEQKYVADFNQDGWLDIRDLVKMKREIAESTPYGC